MLYNINIILAAPSNRFEIGSQTLQSYQMSTRQISGSLLPFSDTTRLVIPEQLEMKTWLLERRRRKGIGRQSQLSFLFLKLNYILCERRKVLLLNAQMTLFAYWDITKEILTRSWHCTGLLSDLKQFYPVGRGHTKRNPIHVFPLHITTTWAFTDPAKQEEKGKIMIH